MYALVDVNSFYASCEKVFRPDLTHKPVIVLSNNDGCVIARSSEAEALGVKMGELYYERQQFYQRNHIHVFSSNYALYGDMSQRVMALLSSYSPHTEIYSIDEAFLDLTGMENLFKLEEYGRNIQATILKCTHLPVSVGIAPTKTLAKMANLAAKRWKKTGGVVDLSVRERQRKLMALISIEDTWGIGRKISAQLRGMGIYTTLDLANTSPTMMRKSFSVVVERTVRELNGEACIAIEEESKVKQQILFSRSFGVKVFDFETMRRAVCDHAERATEKLRKEKQRCKCISLFIQTNQRAIGLNYSNKISVPLEYPSNDTRDIIQALMKGLSLIWRDGYRYYKAGIILSDFTDNDITQFDMFSTQKMFKNSDKLMQTLDMINRSGLGTIGFAGKGGAYGYKMKRELLSPAYTTNLAEIPIVKS